MGMHLRGLWRKCVVGLIWYILRLVFIDLRRLDGETRWPVLLLWVWQCYWCHIESLLLLLLLWLSIMDSPGRAMILTYTAMSTCCATSSWTHELLGLWESFAARCWCLSYAHTPWGLHWIPYRMDSISTIRTLSTLNRLPHRCRTRRINTSIRTT